jgi:hypothetical protein
LTTEHETGHIDRPRTRLLSMLEVPAKTHERRTSTYARRAMPPSAAHVTVAALALVALRAGGASARNDVPAIDVAQAASAPEVEPPAPPSSLAAPSALPEPSHDDAQWSTGPEVGTGVAMKDTGNPRGNNVFIGYAGYNIAVEDAEAWVDALYDAWLRDRGVRYVWAVRGPDDSHYEHKEIGNTKIGAKLRAVAPAASFVLVAAHSSGSCVAHELFKQLAEGRDPEGTTAGKIVYFNLDGIEKGLTPESVARLRRAYFVGAVDRATRTVSPNEGDMRRTAALYASAASASGASSEYVEYDARGAKCASGASWCLHVSLVTNAPHDPRGARTHLDYSEFSRAGVATAFFDARADEAGIARR